MKQDNISEEKILNTSENNNDTSEKEGYTNRQKLIATMSGIAIVIAVGSGVYYFNDKQPKEKPEDNKTEQVVENNTPKNTNETPKEASETKPSTEEDTYSKKIGSKDISEEVKKNTSYKYCPDLKATSCTIEYRDPFSGSTILTTPNKTPENAGGNNVSISGLASLIDDYGMTLEQVNVLKSELKKYSSTLEKPVNEIIVATKLVKTDVNADTGTVVDKFPIILDRSTTVNAKVEYFGIGDPTLTIYNPKNNEQIFQSK